MNDDNISDISELLHGLKGFLSPLIASFRPDRGNALFVKSTVGKLIVAHQTGYAQAPDSIFRNVEEVPFFQISINKHFSKAFDRLKPVRLPTVIDPVSRNAARC